jgi:hypothetical protein
MKSRMCFHETLEVSGEAQPITESGAKKAKYQERRPAYFAYFAFVPAGRSAPEC